MLEILRNPVRDYRKLRPENLSTDTYIHLKLLAFWPVFGWLFWFAEQVIPLEACHAVHCSLDDQIPFLEVFVIPYVFWYVYLVGMHVYTLLYDVEAFRQMMKFIIITYTVTLAIYFLFPNCQNLRPDVFERQTALTEIVADIYAADTNTNVCPSLHVVGSLAVCFTSWHCRRPHGFPGKIWTVGLTLCAMLISASTVFMKQHSVIDVAAAVALCAPVYWYCFVRE
ncbi:MAG: phosphatase PAP2 family protein [Firmicutes bacterium]|nr:phosphatase PAP2 family protein [Bacillota bacterium]